MRRLLLVLTVFIAAACKGKDIVAPVTESTLIVQLEALTCNLEGTFDVELFVDHVSRGISSMNVSTSSTLVTTPGAHLLGARAINGRWSWGATTVTIPQGGSYTAQLGCR